MDRLNNWAIGLAAVCVAFLGVSLTAETWKAWLAVAAACVAAVAGGRTISSSRETGSTLH